MIGKTLGHYQITEKLGEGGMGVVYKARDTRLDRFVALKVLPPEKVSDPDRKRRFIQEAKAASALNHPNIITIHDIDQAEGVDFIAMEYVPGKTLDQVIPRKGLRLNETLKYAVQVADALARAHGAGIIHRDLKPSNVMVDEHGLVKLLDFGLAKLTEAAPSGEDASTRELDSATEKGTIFGTVAYMSPEQAEGKKLDARSDIFSFGSVLYEMLTGQHAFQGDSKISTLSAILSKEPGSLRAEVPHDLEKVVTRCLRKDPERRYQHIDDVKIALLELKEESESGKLAGVRATDGGRLHLIIWAAAALALVIGAGLVFWLLRQSVSKPVAAWKEVPLTSYPGIETAPTFSPDGSQVAFSWNGEKEDNFDIYVKIIGVEKAVRLTKDPAVDTWPKWSPDGRWIAFTRELTGRQTSLMLMAANGVQERQLSEGCYSYPGAWTPDSKYLMIAERRSCEEPFALYLLSVEGGDKQRLTSPPPDSATGDPDLALSPDGHLIAFFRAVKVSRADLYTLALSGQLTPQGEPARVTSVDGENLGLTWTGDGREILYLAYNYADNTTSLRKVAASGSGISTTLTTSDLGGMAVSRKGDRLALARRISDFNIWRLQLPFKSPGAQADAVPGARFLYSSQNEASPQFSPDGNRIVFASTRSGRWSIWMSDTDGTNLSESASEGSYSGTPRWAPDGRRLAFDASVEGQWEIYTTNVKGGKPVRLTNHTADDVCPSWSRDGRWVYFASKRSGQFQVWKVLSEGGEPVQVTKNGGHVAFESTDGKLVYYTKDDFFETTLWKTPVGGGAEQQVLPSIWGRDFYVVARGIYFIPAPMPGDRYFLHFLDFASGKEATIARVQSRPLDGLTVSPDERTILYSGWEITGSDLVLVENFR